MQEIRSIICIYYLPFLLFIYNHLHKNFPQLVGYCWVIEAKKMKLYFFLMNPFLFF